MKILGEKERKQDGKAIHGCSVAMAMDLRCLIQLRLVFMQFVSGYNFIEQLIVYFCGKISIIVEF